VLAEGELALVVKKRAHKITRDRVNEYILGYTIANDLSGRDSPLELVPPAVKKGSDGFLPLGPSLLLDPNRRDFDIQTFLNGSLVQSGNTSKMIFGIEDCLFHISSVITLEAGDVISLGTPPPKPKLEAGDEACITISGIGTLTNRVRST
jgi:2-keto-4-pentenoate hydratase/2-oxohepta-3-ene-1,7-dioic acid hydratase in catechol pathway